MIKQKIIIACDIFRSEMEYILQNNLNHQIEFIWLGAGLHNDLKILESRLNEAWEKIPKQLKENTEVFLMIGQACLPNMKQWAAERNIRLLPTKNCLTALMSEDKLKELEKNKTMVITPSWIRKSWFAEEGIRSILGWDDTDFRINFGRYERILVLDFGLESLSDEEVLETFSIIEVPLEIIPFSLKYFQNSFEEFLNTNS